MARYFKKENSDSIIVIEKKFETLINIHGLEYFNEESKEWEAVNEEGYAHFNENNEFMGIININGLNQVNGNNWVDLEKGNYGFDYDSETVLNREELIELLKSFDGDKVLIQWNGSNFVVDIFLSMDYNDIYEEINLNIDIFNPLAVKNFNYGNNYLYYDSKTKKYYICHDTQYIGDLYKKLKEWKPKSDTLEKVIEEFKNFNNIL